MVFTPTHQVHVPHHASLSSSVSPVKLSPTGIGIPNRFSCGAIAQGVGHSQAIKPPFFVYNAPRIAGYRRMLNANSRLAVCRRGFVFRRRDGAVFGRVVSRCAPGRAGCRRGRHRSGMICRLLPPAADSHPHCRLRDPHSHRCIANGCDCRDHADSCRANTHARSIGRLSVERPAPGAHFAAGHRPAHGRE